MICTLILNSNQSKFDVDNTVTFVTLLGEFNLTDCQDRHKLDKRTDDFN